MLEYAREAANAFDVVKEDSQQRCITSNLSSLFHPCYLAREMDTYAEFT